MSSILIQFVLFFVITGSDSDWSVYFENKKIEISFKEVLCDDVKNGVSFEYYMIKVKNNTNETLVINFYLGDQKDEENKVAFVLNPGEVKTGDCDNRFDLSIYSRDMKISKKESPSEFNLSNINVIEVY